MDKSEERSPAGWIRSGVAAAMKRLFLFVTFTAACFSQVSHPRIWLDSTTMTRLRAQIASSNYGVTAASDSAQYTAFIASANSMAAMAVAPYDRNAMTNKTIYYNYEGIGWYTAVRTLGLAYQVTGNKVYSDKVK
jgi:hypothetical protein